MRFSNKDLRKLIVPMVIEQLLAVTVGLADSFMVSQVNEQAVSAVSLVDTVMILLINVFAALATGGAVVVGQYIGQDKTDKACKATEQLLMFVILLSLVITAALYGGQQLLLHGVFGDIEPMVMNYAKTYLLITAASVPFIAIYNCGAAVFRSSGAAKIAMWTSVAMNIVNVAGNFILIYIVKMEVEGVAIPTLVSRILAAGVVLFLLTKDRYLVHLPKKLSLRFNKQMIKRILRIGVPNGLENSLFQLGKILVLSLVAGFGTTSIAANAVSNSLAMFQILPGLAMSFAVLTVVSQCVGAGNYDEARYYTKKMVGIAYVLILGMNVIIYLALPFILKAYGISAATTELAEQILLYHGICCVLVWAPSFVLPNTLRASNDVKFTMWVAIFSMWIFRIGFSYVLAKYLDMGVIGVWIAMTIDWLFRGICFVFRYVRGKWQEQMA